MSRVARWHRPHAPPRRIRRRSCCRRRRPLRRAARCGSRRQPCRSSAPHSSTELSRPRAGPRLPAGERLRGGHRRSLPWHLRAPARRHQALAHIPLAVLAEGMDEIDRRLLQLLQADTTLSIAQMADRVGLSPTPCWKRIQKLEAGGVITRRVALLDPELVGTPLTAFVAIEAGAHTPQWMQR